MSRSKWTLALIAAVGVALYRQTRPAIASAAPGNLAGSDDLPLPPAQGGGMPDTMWTPSDPSAALAAASQRVDDSARRP